MTEEKIGLVNNKTNVTATYTELEKFNKQAKEQADKEKQKENPINRQSGKKFLIFQKDESKVKKIRKR
ncbi:MAG: hypothetical protein IPO92_24435 [Saprospiraceae bacterium]|nr:hypothetical protein [Saprospiraceae bacterium]